MKNLFRSNSIFIPLGALCYYLAEPSPLNLYFWWAAFLVPVFWSISIGTCSYVNGGLKSAAKIYLTALTFWLASIWWIACPHPAAIFGLAALSAFLSLYWLLFFYSARVAYHKLKIPLWLAMPVCWMGTEFLRCHIFGGFSFCALEHAFYRYAWLLIQPAALGGQYLVGGMIMFYGAFVITNYRLRIKREKLLKSIVSLLCRYAVIIFFVPFIGFACFVCAFRIEIDDNYFSVALLQGNVPLILNTAADVSEKTFEQLVNLAYDTVKKRKENGYQPYDLLVFPETTCPVPYLVFNGKIKPSDVGLTEEQALDGLNQLQTFVNDINTPVVFGISAFEFTDSKEPKRYNTALYLTPLPLSLQFNEPARYDKIQLVMFGEYIPFSEYLPDNFFLKTLCQEAGRGKTPVVFLMGNGEWRMGKEKVQYIPNICFESTVPHFIRKQIATAHSQFAHSPFPIPHSSFLLNISNDAWFRFSRQIDQHLATHVFRAVENGIPCIASTNGGFSAIIGDDGRISAIGNRGEAQVVEGIVFTPEYGQIPTVYQRLGDIPSLLCALLVLIFTFCRFHGFQANRLNGCTIPIL